MSRTRVDIVIPVFNEEKKLRRCVETLGNFLAGDATRSWRVIIADNGSRDDTAEIASELEDEFDFVNCMHLPEPGRGGAIKNAWSSSDSAVLCYMDVDLSTDLTALPELVGSIAEGGFDVAIGSRLARNSTVIGRSLLREVVSRAYNLLLRIFFPGAGISDAQCGFKAVSHRTARELIPLIVDSNWFFDTELLIVARRRGLKIAEVPVLWVDDPDSRVKVIPAALKKLQGMVRLRMGRTPQAPHS